MPDAATVQTVPTAHGGARAPARNPWIVLAVLLSGRSSPTSTPRSSTSRRRRSTADLGASGAALSSSISGYILTYAVLLITGARLGETHGYSRVFLTGIAMFTLASLVCGLAPGVPVLVAARVVQGVGRR